MEERIVDVVFIAPFRLQGIEAISVLNALKELLSKKFSVVLLDSSPHSTRSAPLDTRIVDCLRVPNAKIGSPNGAYKASVTLVWRPTRSSLSVVRSGVRSDSTIVVADREPDVEALRQVVTWCESHCSPRVYIASPHNDAETLGAETSAEPLSGNWEYLVGVSPQGVGSRELVTGNAIVVGRHVEHAEPNWPTSPREIIEQLPISLKYDVRVLGRHTRLLRNFGRTPPNWTTRHTYAPSDIAEIDFWVPVSDVSPETINDTSLCNAFASGAAVILPPTFKDVFGDAAVYAESNETRECIEALIADQEEYSKQSSRAIHWAKTRCADGIVTRLAELGINATAGKTTAANVEKKPRDGRSNYRVMFITSNGAGMGHLTRLLGIARKMPAEIDIIFASLSQATPVVKDFGFPYVYVASAQETGMSAKHWNLYCKQRFNDIFHTYMPDLAVFDGTWIYSGLLQACELNDVPLVWSRRGMWKPEISDRSLINITRVAGAIEPGEFAAEYDEGATAGLNDAARVAPVTILDREELLSRSEACEFLGVSVESRNVLITLGAGTLNSIENSLENAIGAFAEVAPDWNMFVTSNPIGITENWNERVTNISVYPIARYAKAFDCVVSATGYNSFHEWIMAGIPAIWVPNESTQTDDQIARARFAADTGCGFYVSESCSAEEMRVAVEAIVDEERRRAMRSELGARSFDNGAAAAAIELVRLLRGQ